MKLRLNSRSSPSPDLLLIEIRSYRITYRRFFGSPTYLVPMLSFQASSLSRCINISDINVFTPIPDFEE